MGERLVTGSDLQSWRNAYGDATPFSQWHDSPNSYVGPEWVFYAPQVVTGVAIGGAFPSCTAPNGEWALQYEDPLTKEWKLAYGPGPRFWATRSQLPTQAYAKWRVLGGIGDGITHVGYRFINVWVDDSFHRGSGAAKITFKATGNSRTNTTHKVTASAKLTLKATGRGTTFERAEHPRRPLVRRQPVIHEGAWQRQIANFYLGRPDGSHEPLPLQEGTARPMPIELCTSFNGALFHAGHARLRVHLRMVGSAKEAMAFLRLGLNMEAGEPVQDHAAGANLRVKLGLTGKSSLIYQNGAANLATSLNMWGYYPQRSQPDGRVYPPADAYLHVRLRIRKAEGLVTRVASTEQIPIIFGMETEHRIPIPGETVPLAIQLKRGKLVQRWRYWQGSYYPYTYWDNDWVGHILPAARIAGGQIDLYVHASGVLIQPGEAEPMPVNLDMTASYYPWGIAKLAMKLSMSAGPAKATYFGSWRPGVRLDYINFTGKVTNKGRWNKRNFVWLDMTAGNIQDATLGEPKRQRVRLRSRFSGHVYRVREMRPVVIHHTVNEPTHVRTTARTEGV